MMLDGFDVPDQTILDVIYGTLKKAGIVDRDKNGSLVLLPDKSQTFLDVVFLAEFLRREAMMSGYNFGSDEDLLNYLMGFSYFYKSELPEMRFPGRDDVSEKISDLTGKKFSSGDAFVCTFRMPEYNTKRGAETLRLLREKGPEALEIILKPALEE